MKKLLVFLISFCFLAGVVEAVSTTTYYETKFGSPEEISVISNAYSVSSPNSARLGAPYNGDTGPEGRVRIEFNDVVTLNDIENISWEQFVVVGYPSHVDIMLDVGNDGDTISNDALVVEFAYNPKLGHYDNSSVLNQINGYMLPEERNKWFSTFREDIIVNNNS